MLCADRFFSVPENETLEALLDKSADDQQEVTDQLGYQVRKAVEVLIQALDKADQDHGRKLLADVDEKVLYESALTVMMRLVFLFCAEERELLLLGDDLYDKNYAVSTLREQLRVTADQFGEEILGLRYDAWTRLLTSFRAVYAGAKHDRLKLPAYGGSLFNPDRFPFLEGRKLGTSWKTTEATPLPVSNRTVLHLLEALQVLQVRLPGGGAAEARKLSFRSLDIEQIGHVYEGLLDHTAKRAAEPVLGLQGTRDKEPEIALAELEKIAAKGEKELLKFLKDETGRSESALKKGLNAELDDQLVSRFRTACQDSRPVEAGEAVRRAGAARYGRLPGRHHHGQRLRHRRDRPAQQRHALHAQEPDRTHRAVHAGAAGLRRPRRGLAQGRSGSSARPRNCSPSRFATWPAGPGPSWSRRAGTWRHGCSKPGTPCSGPTPARCGSPRKANPRPGSPARC